MGKVQVHVDGVRAMGRRFVDAWHRAAGGEDMHETHVTFLDLESMQATLSPRRLELLRHVRQHGAASVRESQGQVFNLKVIVAFALRSRAKTSCGIERREPEPVLRDLNFKT